MSTLGSSNSLRSLIKASDLTYTYSLTAVKGDNPALHGFPDNALLNSHEQYEVIHFINAFARKYGLVNVASGQKVERMIHAKPSTIHSHKNVEAWIAANWEVFK